MSQDTLKKAQPVYANVPSGVPTVGPELAGKQQKTIYGNPAGDKWYATRFVVGKAMPNVQSWDADQVERLKAEFDLTVVEYTESAQETVYRAGLLRDRETLILYSASAGSGTVESGGGGEKFTAADLSALQQAGWRVLMLPG
jgi:hypothetical protein